MNDPLTFMIVAAVICLAMALTSFYMMSQRKTKERANRTPVSVRNTTAPRFPSPPAQIETPPLPKTPPEIKSPSFPDLLRIHRNPSGAWEILVNGTRYTSIKSLPDETVRQEVMEATRILVYFVRALGQQQKESTLPANALAPSAVTQPAKPDLPPLAKPSPSLVSSSLPAYLSINLAGEIESIVKEMQRYAPALENRRIGLSNAPGGGLNFIVDSVAYESIDEIPDPQVQQLIRAATKEWERR